LTTSIKKIDRKIKHLEKKKRDTKLLNAGRQQLATDSGTVGYGNAFFISKD
jgi:hypothetical protein